MRKILKFLLLPVFVVSPAVTVVACGTSSEQVANEDILNSATGIMQNHTFNMDELGLKQIPSDKSTYDSLSVFARNKITEYYSNLVKPGLNWNYAPVTVSVTTDKVSSNFLTKYGLDVESRINLRTHLTYKNLKAEKDIVIKINNNNNNNQTKLNAIGSFLEKYLKDNKGFVIPFKVLFKDDLKSDEPGASFAFASIEAAFRSSLFTVTKEKPIPVIDVEGVDISIHPDTSNNESNKIYSLKEADAEHKVILGTLENLILTISYGNGFYYQIKGNSYTIAQSFTDTTNQVSTILNQGSQGLQFNKVDLVNQELPKDNQKLADYDSDEQFIKKVTQKMFTFINMVYPTQKINSDWISSMIEIENAASSPYVKESDNYGYFMVNISFSFKIAENEVIAANVGNLKLNLNKN